MKEATFQYFKNIPKEGINTISAEGVYDAIMRAIDDGNSDCIAEIYRELPEQIKIMRHMCKEGWWQPLVLFSALSGQYTKCKTAKENEDAVLKVVNTLVSSGEDINQTFGLVRNTPLLLAIRQGYVSVVSFLLDHADITIKGKEHPQDNPGDTQAARLYQAINIAEECDNQAMIELLLSRGAILEDQKDYHMWGSKLTPLGHAVKEGKLDMAKFLIDKGANYQHVNSSGANILHLAVLYGHTELVDLALEKGLDPKQTDKIKLTPIVIATIKADEEILKKMLQHTGDLETEKSCIDTCKHLVKDWLEEFDPESKSLEKLYIRSVTEDLGGLLQKGHEDLIRLLIEKAVYLDQSIMRSIEKQDYKTAIYLTAEQTAHNHIDNVDLVASRFLMDLSNDGSDATNPRPPRADGLASDSRAPSADSDLKNHFLTSNPIADLSLIIRLMKGLYGPSSAFFGNQAQHNVLFDRLEQYLIQITHKIVETKVDHKNSLDITALKKYIDQTHSELTTSNIKSGIANKFGEDMVPKLNLIETKVTEALKLLTGEKSDESNIICENSSKAVESDLSQITQVSDESSKRICLGLDTKGQQDMETDF